MTSTATQTLATSAADAFRPPWRDEVLAGLRDSPRTLPSRLFYDAEGARLFEAICDLPEYYLTPVELAILEARASEVGRLLGPRCALIEYGSGAGRKVRILLDAMERPAAYVPVDVSAEQLAAVADGVARDYPGLPVAPVCADFTARLRLPPLPPGVRRVGFFPGSTIGNLHPAEASAFLHRVRHAVGPSGAMILGIDRRKDPATLHSAYNDAAGVTAEFNRNLLKRLNRELAAGFDLATFSHVAFFDQAASRIEMHLESRVAQVVCVDGEHFAFDAGETIRTECSYKYDQPMIEAVVHAAGFSIARLWTDPSQRFWVAVLVPG